MMHLFLNLKEDLLAMSRAEIAVRYGLSEGRVKYLLAHARRTLQAKLLQEGITG